MKTRYIIFTAALVLTACAVNNESSGPEGVEMTFTASQEGSADTKSTVQDGGTKVYWEPSEEIKVFFRNSSGRFLSQNTELAGTADFTGTFTAVVGSNEGETSSHLIWGLYPYRADATFDGSSVMTTLPAEQTGRAGSFAKSTNITLAQSEGLNLAFYNVCGGIRFSLTQEGVKEVVFQGQNGEPLAGRIKITFEDGLPAVSEVVSKDSVITLTAPGGGTFDTGKWYYIVALPGTLSNGFKMTFNTDSQYATLKSSGTKTIKRGIFGSLVDADEDLIYKDKGSDEPDPGDVIQFVDPIAKYACVEKFDTNGDGEVSYAEAAEATILSGLFSDWNTVTSFEEIRYFTGITSTQNVFDGCSKLTHITIPDNITTLGSFQNCTALETVVLPEALASLPLYCFEGCSSLTDVTLPAGLTFIPGFAFRNCTALATLDVPSTLMSIGQFAFSGCTALTGIDMPSGLRTIGNYAFQNCSAISSVEFPASLTSIGKHAFLGCTALESVVLFSGVSVDQYAFSGCTALSSVVLPEDMTLIPAYCFQNCTDLASVTWPSALTNIGNYAFDGCRFEGSDYALRLPETVTTIGSNAFGYLRHLILPSASPVSIQSDSFKADYTFLYVPAGMVEMYKVRTNWSNYAERIRPIGDYPVQDVEEVGGAVGEAVDLGMSVKWASWNVGASAPEEYGAYFAWGETEPKLWGYSWAEYYWCDGSYSSLTKYNTNSSYGTVDNKTTLNPEDDAAHVNWGGNWRMPTDAEWTELRKNCTWTWTTVNGVNGRLVTSNKEGYTDKSIFLPAAGYWANSSRDDVGSDGYYWSSSLDTDGPNSAWCVRFYSSHVSSDVHGNRNCGRSVRPVCE